MSEPHTEKKRTPWLIVVGALLAIVGVVLFLWAGSAKEPDVAAARQASASIPVSPPHDPPTVWPDAGSVTRP